jgi:LmbE family N-acetylglucosaminyl deacetylase|tara:strand:+ start:179 stop:826 length:648 start_codon:yes stop_codon:yes gene_type:complete
MKKVLVLAAHPDDETLGCGGVIKNLSDQGYKIELITFTDGVSSRGKKQKNRNEKLKEVSKLLGISKYTYGNFYDNALDSVSLLQLCQFIENNTEGPYDIIFTHFIGDLNIDHQLVTKATLTAFRPQQGHKTKIYSYYVPSSTDYNPLSTFDGNSYFELSNEDVTAKMKALAVYNEEMRDAPHSRSYENVISLMKVWGSEVGMVNCEKFKLIRETN